MHVVSWQVMALHSPQLIGSHWLVAFAITITKVSMPLGFI